MQQGTVLLVRSDAVGWVEVRRVLDAHPQVSVVSEAMSARRAADLAGALKPGVILSAGRIGGVSTRSLLVDLRTRVVPRCRIVVITRRFDPAELDEFADVGIAGHLLWSDLSSDTLNQLLAVVMREEIVVVSRDVVDAFLASRRGAAGKTPLREALTRREEAVLRRLVRGMTHQQIADEELISRRTVERLVASLERKLDADNACALGWKAGRLGLVDGAAGIDRAPVVSQHRHHLGTDSGSRRATLPPE